MRSGTFALVNSGPKSERMVSPQNTVLQERPKRRYKRKPDRPQHDGVDGMMLLARMGVGKIGHRHLMGHLDGEADEERKLEA